MTESKPTRRRATAQPVETSETPKVEAPKVTTPKADTPKPAPKAEAPKVSKVTSPLVFKRRLSQGDHGPAVAEVQRVLSAQGMFEGAEDGRYGTLLAKAVRRFQGAKNIKPTGEVDARTWEAMTA